MDKKRINGIDKKIQMKHLYTIELGGAKKRVYCGIVRLFIEAFRLLAAHRSEYWRVSIRTFCKDEMNGR